MNPRSRLRTQLIRHPQDIKILRKQIPELNDLEDYEIQWLYENYSDEQWCAGWIVLDKDRLQEFRTWLERDNETNPS